jgi:hypothetical protein
MHFFYMDKQDIVRNLLSRGIMVTPETLEKMKAEEIDKTLRGTGSACVVAGDRKDKKLTCRLRPAEKPQRLTPEDVMKAAQHRYETLKGILLGKTDAVSIRNLGRTTAKICVVGQVRDKRQGGFMIEDPTGEMWVKTAENAETGDVIAVKGWVRENAIFAEDIIYPDVPISRKIGVMDGSILLAPERCVQESPVDVVLTPDTIAGDGKERRMPNPAWIFLEKDNKGVTVLVYRTDEKVEKEKAFSWLRKRCIGSEEGPVPDNGRVIDPVPDLLWLISDNEPWSGNYKGVTVISLGRRKKSLIDLKTRKVEIM